MSFFFLFCTDLGGRGEGVGGRGGEAYVPVTAKAVSALKSRQTMIPASFFQELVVQRWPRVQLRFQVRRARPRHQRAVRAVLP